MYYLSDKSSDVKFEDITKCKHDIKRFLDRKQRIEENNNEQILKEESEIVSEFREEIKEPEEVHNKEEQIHDDHERMDIDEFHHEEHANFEAVIEFKPEENHRLEADELRLEDNLHEINFSPFMNRDHDNEFKPRDDHDDFDCHPQDFVDRKFSDLNF